ncbi:MAG: ATP-binding protein [Mucilaginibacter sp.]
MKLATQIALGFFIAISIDLVDSYVNYSLTKKVDTNTSFLINSEAIIRTSGSLNKNIIDMQNALRGFLLSGDRKFLIRYKGNLTAIPALIKQEKALIDVPLQVMRLDTIIELHSEWLKYANKSVDAKLKAIANPALNKSYQDFLNTQFKLSAQKNYGAKTAAIFTSFDQFEYTLREKRRQALSASIQKTDRYSLLFSVLLIITGTAIAYFLIRKIVWRIESMVCLAERISAGDFNTVQDNKRDELTRLSTALNLMSQKLSHNINELERKNEELKQFAYAVSHDLKAPIRGISNVVHWLEEDMADEISPDMKKYLDIIPQRLQRMGDLVDGLLQYARIGRENYPRENVDVTALVKDIGELIIPEGYRYTIGNLPVLFTEKVLLEQIFGNLLSNAVKYTDPANGHIEISCVEHNTFYEFAVADNGIGIEPQYHEKIFEMFQTLRNKHDVESTGLGLSIIKKIVEENAGMVKVFSSLNEGAKFVFTWRKN